MEEDINSRAHHVHFDKSREMDLTEEKNVMVCEDYCGEQFISSLTNYGKDINRYIDIISLLVDEEEHSTVWPLVTL